MTTLCHGVVDQAGSRSWTKPLTDSLGRNSRTSSTDRRGVGVAALASSLTRTHVAQERGPVGLPLGVGPGVEVAQVGRHGELHVHEEHMALGSRNVKSGMPAPSTTTCFS